MDKEIDIRQYDGNLIEGLMRATELKCAEPMRSSDSGRNVLVCGIKSVTYCDGKNCEMQLCRRHTHDCQKCGREFCVSCRQDHPCVELDS